MTQPDITHVWYVDDLVDAPHLVGRHASNSDYSALWEQHLDPVHIPPTCSRHGWPTGCQTTGRTTSTLTSSRARRTLGR
jgi:hypothetical protein